MDKCFALFQEQDLRSWQVTIGPEAKRLGFSVAEWPPPRSVALDPRSPPLRCPRAPGSLRSPAAPARWRSGPGPFGLRCPSAGQAPMQHTRACSDLNEILCGAHLVGFTRKRTECPVFLRSSVNVSKERHSAPRWLHVTAPQEDLDLYRLQGFRS